MRASAAHQGDTRDIHRNNHLYANTSGSESDGASDDDAAARGAPELTLSPQPEALSLPVLARDIRSGEIRNIIVMSGAGISTAAGIPDYGGSLATTTKEAGGASTAAADVASSSSTTILPISPTSAIRTYDKTHPMCTLLAQQIIHVRGELPTNTLSLGADSVVYQHSGVCVLNIVCEKRLDGMKDATSPPPPTSQTYVLHRNGRVFLLRSHSVEGENDTLSSNSGSSSDEARMICEVPEYVRAFFFETCFRTHPDPLVKMLAADPFRTAVGASSDKNNSNTNKGWTALERQLVPDLDALPEDQLHTVYDRVQRAFGLPDRHAWMSTKFLEQHPAAFYQILRKLGLSKRRPTLTHHFIAFLHHKHLLVRHYTQNVDGLHRKTNFTFQEGMQLNQEVHGNLLANRCPVCDSSMLAQDYVRHIALGTRPTCQICREERAELGTVTAAAAAAVTAVTKDLPCVRPDVVLEGESIPNGVMHHASGDFQTCDLLLVMGTSLKQFPFASWIDRAPVDCVRVLINREPVGLTRHISTTPEYKLLMTEMQTTKDPQRKSDVRGLIADMAKEGRQIGFDFANRQRDLFLQGESDEMVLQLLDALQWRGEFAAFVDGGARQHDDTYPLLRSYPVKWHGPAQQVVMSSAPPQQSAVITATTAASSSSPDAISRTTKEEGVATTATRRQTLTNNAQASKLKRVRPNATRFVSDQPQYVPYKRRLTAGSNSVYQTGKITDGKDNDDNEAEPADW